MSKYKIGAKVKSNLCSGPIEGIVVDIFRYSKVTQYNILHKDNENRNRKTKIYESNLELIDG